MTARKISMRPGRAMACGLAAIVPAAIALRVMSTQYRAQLMAAAARHHQHSITGSLAIGFVVTWAVAFAVLYVIAWAFSRARRPGVQSRGSYGGYGGGW
jgi:hypothetical protein